MKEEILNIIKNSNISIDKIQILLNLEEQKVKEIIQELIQEQKVFLNTHDKYEYINEDYFVGRLEKTSKNAAYVNVDGEKISIPSSELKTALKNDLVVVEKVYNHSGTIRGILERKNNKLVCEVKEWRNKLILVPFNVTTDLFLATPKDLLKDYIIGDRVYVTLTNESSEDNIIPVRNITKIGHYNDEFNDELAIAISKDFDIDFSEEALNEANSISEVVQEYEKVGRLDLTNENIFTIDSIHTKDMDDAISIKKLENGNYELGVHIADVAHYLKPNSQLFKEALKRGTSVYLGDVVIPMIPSNLSNGICSLNEGVERLTKSCIMEINHKGKVVNYRIIDSIIKSKKKMVYEELNSLFQGESIDESYNPFIEDLNYMKELSHILSRAKRKSGYINFESSDINVIKDIFENDKILEFENGHAGTAEKLIENFMVIANEVVATDFYWKDLPFIYRTHDIPDEMKLEDTFDQIKELGLGKKLISIQNSYGPKAIQSILDDYKDSPLYSVVSNLLLRSMAKAKYTTENIGHFALALDSYCHFTSPIRRAPDLIVHTLINKYGSKDFKYNNLDKIQIELSEMAAHSSYKERQADDAEKDYIKLKMAEFMEEHKDEEFEGIILDIDKDKVFIKLDNNVKGLVDSCGDFMLSFDVDATKKILLCKYSKQKVKLGTRVLTKVTNVDLPQKQVYLDVKEIIKDKSVSHQKKLEM